MGQNTSERQVSPKERAAATVRNSPSLMGVLPEWLIHNAALLAPPALSARLEEEWRADLAVVSATTFARLRFAVGCCWATGVIVWQHRPEMLPVANVRIRPKAAIGYLSDESGIFENRSVSLFLIAGLHMLLFYVVMTGLAVNIVNCVPNSFHGRLTQSLRPRDLPRPLSLPELSMSTLKMPVAIGHNTPREKNRWP
jgi:hypothetical protein